MNKKLALILIVSAFFFNMVSVEGASNKCSPKISPLTYCTDEEQTESNPNFADPTFNTIGNPNDPNCPSYVNPVNDYCDEVCREEAVTIFPQTINPVSVDKYQPILGGAHFQWEKTSIITRKECKVTIDYNRWETDYQALINSEKEAGRRLLIEWYQYNSDKKCGTSGFVEANQISGAPGYSDSCRCGSPFNEPTYVNDPNYCNGNDTTCTRKTLTVNLIPAGEGGLHCSTGQGTSFKDEDCPVIPGTKILTKDAGIDCEKKKKVCEYWVATPNVKQGTWRSVHLLNVSPSGSIIDNRYINYCSSQGLPYLEVGTPIDLVSPLENAWMNIYRTAKENKEKLFDKLTACNSRTTISKSATPEIKVKYKDPTNNYTNKDGLSINLKLKNSKTEKSDKLVKPSSKVTNGGKLRLLNCNLPSYTDVTKLGNINDYCVEEYSTAYNHLRNEEIYENVKTTYNYSLPSNIFRYSLKSNGESVNSDSPKVTDYIKNNHSYIDIGYPNYPVHYTTPTGEYPIYLEYSNLGTNGYWTKKLSGKIGRYDCTYKVVNKNDVDLCDPKEECCDPLCDGTFPPNPNPKPTPSDGKINVIYRPISLTDPFPAYDGKERTAGENWTSTDITKYITNNRDSKENDVYNETPIYSFTLDAKGIRAIKNYNNEKSEGTSKKRDYNDFDLTCGSGDYNGKRCQSKLLKKIKTLIGSGNASGSCLGSGFAKFYSCAQKPNQDKIKCGLNSKGKYICTDCSKSENLGLAVCKKGSDS